MKNVWWKNYLILEYYLIKVIIVFLGIYIYIDIYGKKVVKLYIIAPSIWYGHDSK